MPCCTRGRGCASNPCTLSPAVHMLQRARRRGGAGQRHVRPGDALQGGGPPADLRRAGGHRRDGPKHDGRAIRRGAAEVRELQLHVHRLRGVAGRWRAAADGQRAVRRQRVLRHELRLRERRAGDAEQHQPVPVLGADPRVLWAGRRHQQLQRDADGGSPCGCPSQLLRGLGALGGGPAKPPPLTHDVILYAVSGPCMLSWFVCNPGRSLTPPFNPQTPAVRPLPDVMHPRTAPSKLARPTPARWPFQVHANPHKAAYSAAWVGLLYSYPHEEDRREGRSAAPLPAGAPSKAAAGWRHL